MPLGCDWDPRKAEANWRKHGVRICDAATALEDEMGLTIPDPGADGERWAALDNDALGQSVVVVYTWRGERARIISARRAIARERRQYEGDI